MSATQSKRQPARRNGNANDAPQRLEPTQELLEAAIAAEEALAEEAAKIRGDKKDLTPQLLMELLPLLRRRIPDGFILEVTSGKGKPYDSTGVRSVQVLIDRMDNVLTPLWWHDECDHNEDGTLAHVKVFVGPHDNPLFFRESHGGVDRGSTRGNIYKGSYTNAAKLAFARVGPGHEIYLGAADLDPDTNEKVAEAQEAKAADAPAVTKISGERAALLRDHFDNIPGDATENAKQLKLKLGSIGVSGRSVNAALAKLTPAQADDVDGWISEQVDAESSS